MSVLNKIRSRAGLLVGIIGLALFSFVIGDIFTSGKSFFGSNDKNIGEIAGKAISINEFEYNVQQETERQKKRNPEAPIDDYTKDAIVGQTWNQMVSEIIMNKQYEKLGITVSDEELFATMLGQNPHPYVVQLFTDPKTGKIVEQFVDPRTGGLNMAKVAEFNQQMNPEQESFWVNLENNVRQSRIAQKYNYLLRKSFYVTKNELKRKYEEENKSYLLKFVVKKYASLPDAEVKVTDEDLKKYYDTHKNEFKNEETSRKIEYISFDAFPSSEDTSFLKQDLEKLAVEFKVMIAKDDSSFIVRESDTRTYDNRYYRKGELSPDIDSIMFSSVKETVVGPYIENNTFKLSKSLDVKLSPDSVKARHILVKIVNGDTVTAKAKIDSLKKLITAKNFGDFAKKNSEDVGSAEKGGDLGWFQEGRMVKTFNDACFSGKKGEIKAVISTYGVHLVEVLDKGAEVKHVKVGTIERKITPSSKTLQSYFTKASEFAGKNSTSELFAKSAEKMNKRIADNVKENDKTIMGIESPRELVRWMYAAKKGDVSQAFEFGNKFVVAQLTEIKEKGFAPFEQVKDEVATAVIQEKKAEKLNAQMETFAQNATSIDAVATKANLVVQNADNFSFARPSFMGLGVDDEFAGAIVTMEKNKLSKPIKGKLGVYVVLVEDVREPAPLQDATAFKNKLNSDYEAKLEGNLFDALKEVSNVQDNRAKWY